MAGRPSIPFAFGPRRAPHVFDFSAVQPAEISSGRWRRRWLPKSSPGCCIRTISTAYGKGLRFIQEYFLVACSLGDLVRRFRQTNDDWNQLPEKVAIQLNDTHPSMAVPELMRILLDEAHLGWDQAWELTRKVLAYTNHTLLPEALEKWPVAWFQDMLPRHLEIIFEINRRLLDDVRSRYPGDETRVANVSLIEEGPVRKVRMANLAIVGSHSTNGVAAIAFGLAARTTTVQDLASHVPGTLQQQDQWRHTPALVVAGQPAPRACHHRGHRRSLDCRSERVAPAQTLGRRFELSGVVPSTPSARPR